MDATNDFIVHFTHKATFNLILPMLPENVHAYKMCVKAKNMPPGMEMIPVTKKENANERLLFS